MRVTFRCLLALSVILSGGEILVRLFICGPSAQVYDREIGYSYLAHSEFFQAREGYARLRLNALGLNDEDLKPKNGRCRVLVVGDSYTTALQVPRDQNFTSVAEQLDESLDVINAGRDGLSLGDVHKIVDRVKVSVRPDLVVYVLNKGDIDDDTQLPELSVVVDERTGEVKHAAMRVEEKERFKEIFAPILRHSALATRLAAQLQPSAASAAEMLARLRTLMSSNAVSTPPASNAPPGRPSREEILAFVYRRLASDIPIALLYIDVLQYSPNHLATVAPASRNAEAVGRKAAASAGVQFFSASEYLIASVKQSGQPPFGFNNGLRPGGHLNAEGHRAVGRALVDLIHEMRSSLSIECAKK